MFVSPRNFSFILKLYHFSCWADPYPLFTSLSKLGTHRKSWAINPQSPFCNGSNWAYPVFPKRSDKCIGQELTNLERIMKDVFQLFTRHV